MLKIRTTPTQLFMGSLYQASKTIPMPEGATVKNGIVTWTARGKTKTGKLTDKGKVTMQVDTWTAQYTDENGEVRRVAVNGIVPAHAQSDKF